MAKKPSASGNTGKQPRRSSTKVPKAPKPRPTRQAPAGRTLPGLASPPRTYASHISEAAVAPYATGREQTIPAGEFKARCLELMDRVRDQHESIVITKHGRPVAKLVPIEEKPARSLWGFMKGTVLWSGDLITPVDEWDEDA